MTIEEKRDTLLSFLSDLYTIQASSSEQNPVLDYKIKVMEKRLEVLGVNDFSELKP